MALRAAAVLMLFLALTHCSEPRFGREFNADREHRGLPRIPEHWVTGNVWSGETQWLAPTVDQDDSQPSHWGKKVAYQDGKRQWEEDYYRSGRIFDGSMIDPDCGPIAEEMIIHYDYTREADPWRCHVISDRYDGLTAVELKQAEKILASWGLSRLGTAHGSKP
jgi:hypothetical protein